jgi:hypothetical protein
MNEDATVMSSLTMDSSFPRDTRKQYRKEEAQERAVVQKDNLEKLNHVSHKLAHIKLAYRIKELQEKVRLAKMIEEVYEESLCDSDDDKSYCPEEEEEECSRLSNYSTTGGGRSRTHRSTTGGDAASECWSQDTSTTCASFDPDSFKVPNDGPPTFEDVGDSVASGRSRKSTKSRSSTQSRSSATSRKSRSSTTSRTSRGSTTRSPKIPPSKVVVSPSLDELKTSFSEGSDGLLEGFPTR